MVKLQETIMLNAKRGRRNPTRATLQDIHRELDMDEELKKIAKEKEERKRQEDATRDERKETQDLEP